MSSLDNANKTTNTHLKTCIITCEATIKVYKLSSWTHQNKKQSPHRVWEKLLWQSAIKPRWHFCLHCSQQTTITDGGISESHLRASHAWRHQQGLRDTETETCLFWPPLFFAPTCSKCQDLSFLQSSPFFQFEHQITVMAWLHSLLSPGCLQKKCIIILSTLKAGIKKRTCSPPSTHLTKKSFFSYSQHVWVNAHSNWTKNCSILFKKRLTRVSASPTNVSPHFHKPVV